MGKIQKILLIGVFLIAITLRYYQLGSVPISPDWDEVALGYNAYSILMTGKDEYGKLFPVVLESFDDYKPALYAYLVIPFIKIFGLDVFTVRLPSVLFGILAVIGTYLLVLQLFKYGKDKKNFREKFEIGNWRSEIATLASFLLAISPWHIQFSRVAFEANVALTFNIFALLFFLYGLKQSRFYIISFICAALSIYTYQSEKVFIPLLFILVFIIFRKELMYQKKGLLIGLFSGLLVILPMVLFITTNPKALTRAKGVSIFSNEAKFLKENVEKVNRDVRNNDILGLILDNRRIEYAKGFFAGYIAHYDLNWLFYSGDIPRHHAPYMGLLYIIELPFILVGIYKIIFSTLDKKIKCVIFSYFLAAPIPAAVTIDVPHAVRILNVLPMYQLFSAVGIVWFLQEMSNIKSNFFKYTVFGVVAILSFLNFLYYLNQYFVQQNYYYSKYWQYGYKELISYILPRMDRYDQIVVSNEVPLDQSYMFFLFYLKYDPVKYLAAGGTKNGSLKAEHTGFENLVFRPIRWEEDRNIKNSIFIGRPDDLPVNIDKTIYFLNGEPAIETSITPK